MTKARGGDKNGGGRRLGLPIVNRLACGVANQFDSVAGWVGNVDAFGAVAVRVNGFPGALRGVFESRFVHAKRDVHRVLRRGDERQFPLTNAQKRPRRVLVQNLGAEFFDIERDALRDVAGFERDVIHFKHGGQFARWPRARQTAPIFAIPLGQLAPEHGKVFGAISRRNFPLAGRKFLLATGKLSALPALRSMPTRRPSSSPFVPPPPDFPPSFGAAARARKRRRQRTALRRLAIVSISLLAVGMGAWAWKRRAASASAAFVNSVPRALNPRIARAEKLATPSECDVLVIGGTPSGVAAAISAARAGARVVLAEPRPLLGGDITYAWINQFDVPMKRLHESRWPISYGIFGEFFKSLDLAFPPEKARALMEQKLAELPNIRVLTRAQVAHLNLEDGRLRSVLLHINGKSWLRVSAPAIVDATNDADIAAQAGSAYAIGRQQANADRAMQAAGLFFKLRGVKWDEIRRYTKRFRVVPLAVAIKAKPTILKSADARLRGNQILIHLGGGVGPYAWERGDIIHDYVPHGKDIKVMSINLGRTGKDECVLNTLNILGVNGLSRASRQHARREALEELPFLVAYLKTKMPGLENAELAGAAPELYIRETRHIVGLEPQPEADAETVSATPSPPKTPFFATLSARDVQKPTIFPDRIALCAYSMDLHPYKFHEPSTGTRRWVFTLPLSALLPKRVDGVFVASRSLSATWMAAGAARVIPVTMAAGEAAGLCAAMCAQQSVSPHEFVADPAKIAELQDALRAGGVDVGDNARALALAAKPKIGGG